MKSTTPAYAKIETIRAYERIPEKSYRWKIFILLLFDLFLIYMAFHYSQIEVPGNFKDDFLYIFKYGILDIVGTISYSGVIFIIALYIVVFGVIPILIFMSIKYYIPWIFKNIFKVINLLNPFNHQESWNNDRFGNLKRHFKEQKEIAKKVRKVEPLLSFRDTKIGVVTIRWIAFVHWVTHLYFIGFGAPLTFFSGRNDFFIYKIFIIIYVINLIVFILLAREPGRSIKIAEEKLKFSFKYYCEPPRRAELNLSEKQLFDENFSYRLTYGGTHTKGHFKSGIYQNQEQTFSVTLHVKDLKNGLSYALKYQTNRDYKYWDGHHGVEVIVKGGNYTRNKYL